MEGVFAKLFKIFFKADKSSYIINETAAFMSAFILYIIFLLSQALQLSSKLYNINYKEDEQQAGFIADLLKILKKGQINLNCYLKYAFYTFFRRKIHDQM